jgi:hypothetical protein
MNGRIFINQWRPCNAGTFVDLTISDLTVNEVKNINELTLLAKKIQRTSTLLRNLKALVF